MKKKNSSQQTQKRKLRPVGIPRGFPPHTKVELVYEDLINLKSISATYASYEFRGNSLFDPDYTGVGHQPRYYDQYSAVYNRYKVLGCRMEVELINYGSVSPVMFAVVPQTDVVSATTWPEIAELPLAKSSKMIPVASRYPISLTHSASTTTVCGLLPNQVNDEDWSAQVGANPQQIWYWSLFVIATNGTSYPDVQARIRLTYDAVLYDRIKIPVS